MFEVNERYLQIFKKKIIFIFTVIKKNNENCVARAAEIGDFFKLNILKIYLIDSNVTIFESRKRTLNLSTLICSVQCPLFINLLVINECHRMCIFGCTVSTQYSLYTVQYNVRVQ